MSNNTQNLATDNNIEITYVDSEENELTLRFEMLIGFSVDEQAVKCKEMLDVLRQHKILKNCKKGRMVPLLLCRIDIPTKIKKLNELKEAGILSEEFQQKKVELFASL